MRTSAILLSLIVFVLTAILAVTQSSYPSIEVQNPVSVRVQSSAVIKDVPRVKSWAGSGSTGTSGSSGSRASSSRSSSSTRSRSTSSRRSYSSSSSRSGGRYSSSRGK